MAANAARAGFELVVFNRTESVADEFVALHGGRKASSVVEVVEDCDLVVTMLSDGESLLAVWEEAWPAVREGTVAIDMGTSGTEAVERLRARLEERGGVVVDAPVSGSTPAAEARSLLVMVGARPQVYGRVEPLLGAIGKPELVGPEGAGAALKLTVNSILYAVNQAFAEGVALAEAGGVAPAVTHDVVSRSAAGAPMIGYRKAQYLDPDHSPVTFTLDLAAKDLRLALAAAEQHGVAMPQLVRTLETVEALIERGYGGRDMGYVVEAARATGHPEIR
jgi:3-hydroxyisobutyrate dehydrogenase-like beta-hydroxyacid dehydrogenase